MALSLTHLIKPRAYVKGIFLLCPTRPTNGEDIGYLGLCQLLLCTLRLHPVGLGLVYINLNNLTPLATFSKNVINFNHFRSSLTLLKFKFQSVLIDLVYLKDRSVIELEGHLEFF